MDEVLEKLTTAVVVDEDAGSKSFQDLYKNWGKLGNQEQRRKDMLLALKKDRQNKLDKVRGVIPFVEKHEEMDIFSTTPRAVYIPKTRVPGFTRAVYKDVLMLSEWMIEKPEVFTDETWYVVPCPKGKRVLLVATACTTKLFSKCGRFVTQIKTALPGGNSKGIRKACTVLDGIYCEKLKTVYILDMLGWNNRTMSDTDVHFRQYWLRSRFDEYPEVKTISKENSVRLELLDFTPCSPDRFNSFMMKYPHFENFQPALDGLLFYHANATYMSGDTPLVGWLYPYMVPEVFGPEITVHPQYMEEKPKDYVDQATFIQKFEEKYAKKKVNRSRGAMEISEFIPENVQYEGYCAIDDDYVEGDNAEGNYAEGDYAEGDYSEGYYAEGDYAEGDYAQGDYAEGDYAEGDYADYYYTEGDYAEGYEMEAEGMKEGDETGAEKSVQEGDATSAEKSVKGGDETGAGKSVAKGGDETVAEKSVKGGDETGAEKSVKEDIEVMESENVADEDPEQKESQKGSSTNDEENPKQAMEAEKAPK